MFALAIAFAACHAQSQSVATALMRPTGVAYDAAGDLFIADSARNQVFEISVGGAVAVVAGNGTQGFSGDSGPATAAQLNAPMSVAVATDGTLYIADTGNQRIRAVQGGNIATFAGNGDRGFSGDGGLATAASLNRPVALAIDTTGALLVCDQGNERVRRISAGQIKSIAGDGVQGFAGDGGSATSAELNEPSGIAESADDRIFIADTNNQRVRVVDTNGTISTFAGTGVAGILGDGGPASSSQLSRPVGLAIDAAKQSVHRGREQSPSAQDCSRWHDHDNRRKRPPGCGDRRHRRYLVCAESTCGHGGLAIRLARHRGRFESQRPDRLYRWKTVFAWRTEYAHNDADSDCSQRRLRHRAEHHLYRRETRNSAGPHPYPRGRHAAGKRLAQSGRRNHRAANPEHRHTHTHGHLRRRRAASDPPLQCTSITISPASVTATATGTTISYGAPLPALTGSLTGVLPQDQGNVLAVFTVAAASMGPVGSYPITANLTGAASNNYSLSLAANSGTLTIVPAATTAMLAAPSIAYATLPLQLTVRVASTTSGTPTGTVQFLDAGNVIATAPLVNGSASAIELNPSSGSHTLAVAYSGDTNFHASTSANVIQAVNALPDFTVGNAGSSQQTVIAGSLATFGLTVGSQGAPFTGAVTLSANGLPPGATASFSPPAVVPGASSVAVTMTVATRATTALKASAKPELALAAAGAILLFALRRRRSLSRLFAVFAVAGLLGLAGCGARTASESVLPVQSFTIHVQATGTNLAGNVVVHAVSVTLGVE